MTRLRHYFDEFFQKIWYAHSRLNYLLRPLTWLYCAIITIRRILFQLKFLKSTSFDVPVIIVGNLTVGGTGKTPLVIWIANYLKKAGYKPGIITKGYLGKARSWPQQVRADSDPVMVGDESIVIAQRTACPIASGPDRVASCAALLKYHNCDVIISDDGLQHYQLARFIEIIVIDGVRRFGNGHCLPAGPLREPVQRLDKVDFVVTNGIALNNEYAMRYIGKSVYNLADSTQTRELTDFRGMKLHAVAAIGNPAKFFEFLTNNGLTIIEHAFPDHYLYLDQDINFNDNLPIIMTEKDAVKCRRFVSDNMWVLPVEVSMKRDFGLRFLETLNAGEA